MGRSIVNLVTKHKACTEDAKAKAKAPSNYKVLLINDDYTPMEFVIKVLQHFFHKGENEATSIMWEVHTKGKAVCGLYTHEIAETKVYQVIEYAALNEYPLLCVMEKA